MPIDLLAFGFNHICITSQNVIHVIPKLKRKYQVPNVTVTTMNKKFSMSMSDVIVWLINLFVNVFAV